MAVVAEAVAVAAKELAEDRAVVIKVVVAGEDVAAAVAAAVAIGITAVIKADTAVEVIKVGEVMDHGRIRIKEEDGTRADKAVIIAVVIGATTISAVVINRDMAVVLYATISIRVVDRHPMALIRALAVDNLATRDGYRLLVDKDPWVAEIPAVAAVDMEIKVAMAVIPLETWVVAVVEEAVEEDIKKRREHVANNLSRW